MPTQRRKRPTQPVGTPAPTTTKRFGPVGLEALGDLLASPLPCTFWLANNRSQMASGILLRDSQLGLQIRTTQILDGLARDSASTDVVQGETESGMPFTMFEAYGDGFLQEVIYSQLWFVGSQFEREPTFTRLGIWIDELPIFVDGKLETSEGRTSFRHGETVNIGAVSIKPEWVLSADRYRKSVESLCLVLEASQAHRVGWWLEKWVNPIEYMLPTLVRRPSAVTLLSIRDFDRQQVPMDTYFGMNHWPTLELSKVRPKTEHPPHEPLLTWSDDDCDLSKLIPGYRRLMGREKTRISLDNYRETLYADLPPRLRFLNMVQAAEALHTSIQGRYQHDPDAHKQRVASRVKRVRAESDLSRRDVRAIERALLKEKRLEYSLEQRLRALADGLDGIFGTKGSWFAWVADARNKLSHGEPLGDKSFKVPEAALEVQRILEYRYLVLAGYTQKDAARVLRPRPHWS